MIGWGSAMFESSYESANYIPKNNVKIGTWYLHRLHDHYNCDTIEKILMAYNWGIGNCRKHNFDLSKAPKETRDYVVKIMKLYNKED